MMKGEVLSHAISAASVAYALRCIIGNHYDYGWCVLFCTVGYHGCVRIDFFRENLEVLTDAVD